MHLSPLHSLPGFERSRCLRILVSMASDVTKLTVRTDKLSVALNLAKGQRAPTVSDSGDFVERYRLYISFTKSTLPSQVCFQELSSLDSCSSFVVHLQSVL